MPNRRSTLAHVLLLLVVLVWGTTFPLVKSALAEVSPLLFNLLRMALAFAALLAINASALRHITKKDLKLSAITGLFLALGYQFQTSGLALTTPSKAAFITGLVVVLVPLLSAIPGVSPHHPKPSPAAYAGAILAFVGLVLLTSTPNAALLSGFGLGEFLCLLCALAFAAHLLCIARAAPLVPARRLGTLQIGFAALAMLVTLPLQQLSPRPIHFHSTSTVWLALAITSLLATAAAFTIQSWAQQQMPPSHTALIFTMEPVFAWLFSLVFFHDHLGPRALTGAALILAGILLAELLQPQPTPG